MPDTRAHDPDLPIAEALQRLPLEAPDRSAWPLLQKRLATSRKPRARWPFALAGAAVSGHRARARHSADGRE